MEITVLETFKDHFTTKDLEKVNKYFESEENGIINSKVGVEQIVFSELLFIGDESVLVHINKDHYKHKSQIINLFTK